MVESIPVNEFLGMFDRFVMYVNVGKIRDKKHLRARIQRVLNLMKSGAERAKRPRNIKKWTVNRNHLKALYDGARASNISSSLMRLLMDCLSPCSQPRNINKRLEEII